MSHSCFSQACINNFMSGSGCWFTSRWYVRSGIQLLTNTGCKLMTSLWSLNCRVHRPGWFTRKAHCTHSPLSAPLKMHLLWVTWSQQLSTAGRSPHNHRAGSLCLWLRHRSARPQLHLMDPTWSGSVWCYPALSGWRHQSPGNLDFVFHKVENITFTTQNKITTLLFNKTCFNRSQMFLIKLN